MEETKPRPLAISLKNDMFAIMTFVTCIMSFMSLALISFYTYFYGIESYVQGFAYGYVIVYSVYMMVVLVRAKLYENTIWAMLCIGMLGVHFFIGNCLFWMYMELVRDDCVGDFCEQIGMMGFLVFWQPVFEIVVLWIAQK